MFIFIWFKLIYRVNCLNWSIKYLFFVPVFYISSIIFYSVSYLCYELVLKIYLDLRVLLYLDFLGLIARRSVNNRRREHMLWRGLFWRSGRRKQSVGLLRCRRDLFGWWGRGGRRRWSRRRRLLLMTAIGADLRRFIVGSHHKMSIIARRRGRRGRRDRWRW